MTIISTQPEDVLRNLFSKHEILRVKFLSGSFTTFFSSIGLGGRHHEHIRSFCFVRSRDCWLR